MLVLSKLKEKYWLTLAIAFFAIIIILHKHVFEETINKYIIFFPLLFVSIYYNPYSIIRTIMKSQNVKMENVVLFKVVFSRIIIAAITGFMLILLFIENETVLNAGYVIAIVNSVFWLFLASNYNKNKDLFYTHFFISISFTFMLKILFVY